MKKYLLCMLIVALTGLSGCREKGSVEKAGEKLDEAIDNVKNGDSPLREKGTLEKAGKSIDDSIK